MSQFPGALNTENGGINNLGISVGDYCLDAFGNQCHGYRRSANGVFTSIEPSGALDSFAANININGVIVGSYHAAPGPTGLHCFVFVPVPGTPTGFYTTIDVPSTVPGPFFGGFAIRCRGINDLGQIVGAYNAPDPTTGQIVRHGFLLSGNVVTGGVFTPGVFTPIDVPGAARTDPARINNLGQIVGRYMQGGVHHGFLFDGTTYTSIDFPAVPAAKETVAGGINNLGQIVGTYRDANDFLFGFIRTPNASQPPTYTQIVLPGPGQNVAPLLIKAGVGTFPFLDFTSWVGGINDRGQISGEYWGIENLQGLLSGVHVHGFVTAPKQDFEVTGSAVVSGALVSGAPGPISGAFEGDPIGEGSFTLTNLFVPRDIPFGLFVNCGRVPPPLTLVLTTNTGDQISVELLVTLCQTRLNPCRSLE